MLNHSKLLLRNNMPLLQKISDDIKSAMKAKDSAKLETLRMLKSEIGKKEIAKGKEVTDDEAFAILRTYAKQQEEGKENFAKGGRQDLVDKATAEIALVKTYLPAAMSEADIEIIAKAKISELNATAKDFGMVMKAVMAEVAGRAEGAAVTGVIKKMLQ